MLGWRIFVMNLTCKKERKTERINKKEANYLSPPHI